MLNELHRGLRINRWLGIWHTCHAGESASKCRGRAGCNRFIVFATWFAQVNVNIEQPWRDDLTRCVDHLVGRRRMGIIRGNASLGDKNICHAIHLLCWIDDASVFYDKSLHVADRISI